MSKFSFIVWPKVMACPLSIYIITDLQKYLFAIYECQSSFFWVLCQSFFSTLSNLQTFKSTFKMVLKNFISWMQKEQLEFINVLVNSSPFLYACRWQRLTVRKGVVRNNFIWKSKEASLTPSYRQIFCDVICLHLTMNCYPLTQ